ncbi:hypothetical protein O181_026385 [Austropuccinia psidii MF-1]|uniref:Integrase catalytic domain-containing protein n=1 Tax=Austropuccinia psidii MF-1 TaxID=1389203 RepID=A0A9Q3H246_9BASI|nr:hypothetical protein [Austropuccinia psidii MF-1]
MARTVMLRLENEVANKGRNPNHATWHQILESAYQQHQSNTKPTKQDDTIVFNKASVVNSSAQGGTHDANDIDLATLRAIIWAKRTKNASSPLIKNASQFRAYYPIITLPTWSVTRLLVAADSQKPKMADYYQPNYQNKAMAPVNVCFAELGDDKDLMNLFQEEADAAAVLQGAIIRWEVTSGKKLKTLRTDGGSEFWSKGMNHWCTTKGIAHEQSLPMHQKQKGVSKREKISVSDMGRTILQSSGMGNPFWVYAFMLEPYTNNNIPNERMGISTPVEVLFNKKPQLDKMQIFGEKAYMHIPQEHCHKLGTSLLTSILRKGHPFEPQDIQPSKKMDIPFLLNNTWLGSFGKEKNFTKQEQMVEKIAKLFSKILKSYKEAMDSNEGEEWSRAIGEELQNMEIMDVFEVSPLDKMQHTINGGWIFAKRIDNLSGKLVHSFDFTSAYLNALLDMEVWIKLQVGMNITSNMGCCLKKALYGTKQSGRCWWEHLGGILKALGFSKSALDNSVYFNIKNNGMTWINVDDGIIIAQTKKELDDLKQGLANNFMIKWKDGVERMVGMEVQRQAVGFTLTQKQLVKRIIVEHWDGKKTNTTP